jgi:hypothetical protein
MFIGAVGQFVVSPRTVFFSVKAELDFCAKEPEFKPCAGSNEVA